MSQNLPSSSSAGGDRSLQQPIGFIGAGMMAEALIEGLISGDVISAQAIVASDVSAPRRRHMAERYGIQVTDDNHNVLQHASTVVLAVKPQHAPDVLRPLRSSVVPNHLFVSMMAGVATSSIRRWCADNLAVVRVMPNIATTVKEAATAIAPGHGVDDAHIDVARRIFTTVGKVVVVSEDQMDAVTGLSGSGPAYVMLVIEALADGGVAEGLPRDVALALATQTVLGGAAMVRETGDHPALVQERVTSPAGTTAEGLAVLEDRSVRAAFITAVRAASRRSRQLNEAGEER